jgi:hypothetical protein
MGEPLVTADEVTAGWAAFSSLDGDYQDAVIAAASQAVEAACGRPIGLASYAEVFRPGRTRKLRLKTYPLVGLDRLACDLSEILTLQNTSGAVSRATVEVSALAMNLRSTASGIPSVTGFAFGDYPTAAALAAALNGVSGWSASVPGVWSNWATADLYNEPGSYGAKDRAFILRAFTRDLSDFLPDFERGVVELREGFAQGFQYPDRMFGGDPRLYGVFASYRAGYATGDVPATLKAAARVVAKGIHDRAKASGVYKSEALGARSWTLGDLDAGVTKSVMELITGFIDWRVV